MTLADYGAGLDRGCHVSLVDVMALLDVAGIDDPGPADPPRGWRDVEAEIQARVWRTSLYAARDACQDAPPGPDVEPPDVCYSYEVRQRRRERPSQADLGEWSA